MAKRSTKAEGAPAARRRIAAFMCRACAGKGLEESVRRALGGKFEVDVVRLVCSGQLRTGFLLAALEGGADAAVLFACPEDGCRYGKGSGASLARIEKARRLLESLGISGGRIGRFETSAMAPAGLDGPLAEFASKVEALGALRRPPAPAAEPDGGGDGG